MSRFLVSGFKLIIGFGSLVAGILVYFQAGMFINIATSLMTNPNIELGNEAALANTIQTFDSIQQKSIILIVMGLFMTIETSLRGFMSNFKTEESKKDYER